MGHVAREVARMSVTTAAKVCEVSGIGPLLHGRLRMPGVSDPKKKLDHSPAAVDLTCTGCKPNRSTAVHPRLILVVELHKRVGCYEEINVYLEQLQRTPLLQPMRGCPACEDCGGVSNPVMAITHSEAIAHARGCDFRIGGWSPGGMRASSSSDVR
jgi:hypothetical protein